MPLQNIVNQLLSYWPIFATLLGLHIVIRLLASPHFKGMIGEWMVCRGLDKLDLTQYSQFHDLYLPRPDGNGSTQLDHVVVSSFGIFVIETKNYRGWIFGSEKQREWTQQIYRAKHRFQNPLHQNYLHVKALVQFLDLSENQFHSLVFFIGGAEFKTPMPANVINRGLLAWIRSRSVSLIDPAVVSRVNTQLESLCQRTNRKTAARNHTKALKAREA
jgi:restriction system protein